MSTAVTRRSRAERHGPARSASAWGVLLLAVALVATLGGCDPAEDPEEEAVEPDEAEDRTEVAVVAEDAEEGEALYEQNCMACHGPEGEGAGDGAVLPLADNPFVAADDPEALLITLVEGRSGMPSFGGLDDDELAAIATYIRQIGANDADPVDADEVSEVRED